MTAKDLINLLKIHADHANEIIAEIEVLEHGINETIREINKKVKTLLARTEKAKKE